MPIFEVVSPDHSEIIDGSTHYQVALAISRKRCVFESLTVQDLASDRETFISGTTLLSLAYLDNHYQREDEEWNFK